MSFRVDSESLKEFDRIAKVEMRSRGNMIATVLDRSLKVKKVLATNLEYLVNSINEEEATLPKQKGIRGQSRHLGRSRV